MNKDDWRMLQVISAALALGVALHGITNRKWQEAHTIGTLLGVAGTIGPELFG
jgi:hypothetical protein